MASTKVYDADLGFERLLRRSGKHSFLLDLGYRYGRRDYLQTYESNEILVITKGISRLPSLYFSVGYGFNF